MTRSIKSIFSYLVAVGIMTVLLWLSLRGLNVQGEDKWSFIWNTWKKSDKWYLMSMAIILLISHIFRAERWKMLLKPTGHSVTFVGSLLSLLIGYLVNLAIPRGGEVTRCYNLYKLDKAPVEVSFGTVVVERIIDLLFLFLLVIAAFVIEWSKLSSFFKALPVGPSGFAVPFWAIGVMILIIIVGVVIFLFRKNERLRKILVGFRKGFVSIFSMERKGLFFIYTIIIWLLYFVMTYLVIKAFPETSSLGVDAVITIFAIGVVAISIPLPGGAGSYHTLVPLGLVLFYNLPNADAVAFVFVFHAWQTLILILGGVVSLIISYFIVRWRKV